MAAPSVVWMSDGCRASALHVPDASGKAYLSGNGFGRAPAIQNRGLRAEEGRG